MATIFITGGSGFVGRHTIHQLSRQGRRVRALARSNAAADRIVAAGGEPVLGDLASADDLARAMHGCDAVIHAAAKVEQWGAYEDFYAVNVFGTENVLAAARRAGVKRFVHVGTEAGLVGGRPVRRATEEFMPPARPVGLYPATKRLAEERVLAANCAELETVVVRPRFIWGRGDTSLLPQLVSAVKQRKFLWISGGRYLTSTCHIENVLEGIGLALDRGRGGNAYFLTDGEPTKFRSFIAALLATQGLEAPRASIPRPVASLAARGLEAAWRWFDLAGEPPLTRTVVLLMGEEVTVSDAKARRELGYTGSMSRERGLDEMRS